MKPNAITSSAALALGLLFSGHSAAATLEVKLNHVRPTGTVRVSVFANPQDWNNETNPVAQREIPARSFRDQLRFEGLAPGKYAVRVEQGPNHGGWGNAEPPAYALERRGTSGIPTRYGRPGFERSAITVDATGGSADIYMFEASHY